MKTVEKPIVSLRVYRGKQVNYDENGKIRNENQTIKITHDTREWVNQLKHLRANGYVKVDVEEVYFLREEKGKQIKVPYGDIDSVKKDVEKAHSVTSKEQLTPEQKKIAELEAKLEAFIGASKKSTTTPKKVAEISNPDKDLKKQLMTEYKELKGKRGAPMWSIEDYKQKIAELKSEQ